MFPPVDAVIDRVAGGAVGHGNEEAAHDRQVLHELRRLGDRTTFRSGHAGNSAASAACASLAALSARRSAGSLTGAPSMAIAASRSNQSMPDRTRSAAERLDLDQVIDAIQCHARSITSPTARLGDP
jgi:hypothetical protein